MGSGKTLSMSIMAFSYFKQGYKVYSNYTLNFEHTKVNKEFMESLISEKQDLGEKVLFCMDEFDVYTDSRSSMSSTNKKINGFLKQLRKYNAIMFVATQYKYSLDKRLRGFLRCEILCYSKKLELKKKGFKPVEIVIIFNEYYKDGYMFRKKRFVGNHWFGLYDTKELITDD